MAYAKEIMETRDYMRAEICKIPDIFILGKYICSLLILFFLIHLR
jgi:hypothetical protein